MGVFSELQIYKACSLLLYSSGQEAKGELILARPSALLELEAGQQLVYRRSGRG